jgi:hypothetical protein
MKRKLCIRFIVKCLTFVFVSAIFISTLISCSQSANEAVEVTFENITQHEEGTLVAIEGELNLPSFTTTYFDPYTTTCLELCDFDSILQSIDIYIIGVEAGKTSEPNRMAYLPISYEYEDLVVWLDDGTAVGDGAAVHITGWLGINDNGDAYINPVEKIEASSAPLNQSLSPDNTKIVFVSWRNGNSEIYIMNADGSEQVNLTNNPLLDSDPCFSPDGSKIIFVSERDGNKEIYIMNIDGSEQTNLTNNSAWDSQPSFSPDGSKIIFVSERDGNKEIYIMNIDGSEQTNLTNNLAADFAPNFSPDGNKIVFWSDRNVDYGSYIMNIDGSEQTQYEEEF